MTDHALLFSAPMVLALLREIEAPGTGKTETRRILKPSTCMVLGSRVRESSPAWQGLDLARAIVRTQSTLMRAVVGIDAPYDLHLDAPFRHPDDVAAEELVYRVRPLWEPGDSILVRETLRYDGREGIWRYAADQRPLHEVAGRALERPRPDRWPLGFCPSIHMPRWASRITLDLTKVDIERLHEITPEAAEREGLSKRSKDAGRLWKYGIPDRDGDPGEDDVGWQWHRWRISPVDAFEVLWGTIHGEGAWAANPWVFPLTFTPRGVNIDSRKAAT